MKKNKLLLFFVIFPILLIAQNKYTISGYVEDISSNERLLNANIYETISGYGTTTNNFGFYSLTLSEGDINIYASYIGYQTQTIRLNLKKDTLINIHLNSELSLDEIVITGYKDKPIQEKTQMSVIEIKPEDIEKIPTLLGENDVLKALQLLPGVQGGTEGLNGLYVRGGSPDQNLIILDGVPVYNVSHLMGFVSVFNTDAIKTVSLTKGGFPARYGGRLSSVIEINMKEGNKQEFHGEGSIGLLSSRLTIEGPIVKGKTSFMVSGRRNYIDIFAKPIIKNSNKKSGDDIDLTAYFYDLNAKINHQFNDKHSLYLSAYLGADAFGRDYTENDSNSLDYFKTMADIDWGNTIVALRWNYKINNKLFANTTATYSRFNFDFTAGQEDNYEEQLNIFSAKYRSEISDFSGKLDFDYRPNPNHYIRFGIGNTYHTYNPGALAIRGNFEDDDLTVDYKQTKEYSNEYFAYLEDEMTLGKLKANIGVHASGFTIKDQTYTSVQPRVGLRYLVSDNISIKGSFATMTQYINLLTNESIGLPTDLWVPSTEKIKPQNSWQGAIGIATTLKEKFEISLEGYYKEMSNVISYKEGANFFNIEENWEDKITQGNGKAYGVELFLQKKKGKTTGWIGYTLAWNFRQFDEINSGVEFPFKFDRRHDFEAVVIHKFNKRIHLSGTWVYGTGNAISLTEATYTTYSQSMGSNNINIIGSKNSYRMAPYHRLDLGIEFIKKKKWGERAWILGVYNVYMHANPFYIYLGYDFETEQQQYRQVSLLPLVPSISYRFKF